MKVYLDNSATSYPKPLAVEKAVGKWFKDGVGNANRSSGSGTREIERMVYETRNTLGRFFNFDSSDHVIFTKNITEALNLIILGYLRPKDHVIVSGLEHNGVIRPLEAMKKKMGITYTQVPLRGGEFDFKAYQEAFTPKTKLVIMTHASNVSGDILPIREIGKIAHDNQVPFLLDSAQSAGVLPIDMVEDHIDFLAFTGHKGLMGPQGIGGVLINPKYAHEIEPLMYGGTGSYSESLDQPETLPDRFESGTLNALGICGLLAGIQTLEKIGLDRVLEHEQQLIKILQEAFINDPRVTIVGNPDYTKRVGVLSIKLNTMDNALFAYELSKQFGVSVRVGLQCAPQAHEQYGSFPVGTVRFSTSFLNTIEEMHYAVASAKDILAQA